MSSVLADNSLSIRLQTIFDSIPSDVNRDRFIDVGSDHGHLTCYALKFGGFKRSVSTDIHKDPAEKTRQYLEENKLSSVSEVYCTDGLDGVALEYNDVVVMAGLGGNNIIDILKRVIKETEEDILKSVIWVLQPQKTIEELRQFACDSGFSIFDEVACVDREIYYNIALLKFDGVIRKLDIVDKYYGPVLRQKYISGEKVVVDFFKLLDDRYELRARGDEETKKMLSIKKGL